MPIPRPTSPEICSSRVHRRTLTDLEARNLPPPASGRLRVYDSDCPNLSLVIHATGARRWWFTKRNARGVLVRQSLGDATALPVRDARTLCGLWLTRILTGDDPSIDRKRMRDERRRQLDEDRAQAMTVEAAWKSYHESHLERTARRASLDCARIWWRKYLAQLGPRRLSEFRQEEAVRLCGDVGGRIGGPTANRVRSLARAIWQHATRRMGYTGVNPWKLVDPYPEEPRARVLTADEWNRLHLALGAMPAFYSDFVLIRSVAISCG